MIWHAYSDNDPQHQALDSPHAETSYNSVSNVRKRRGRLPRRFGLGSSGTWLGKVEVQLFLRVQLRLRMASPSLLLSLSAHRTQADWMLPEPTLLLQLALTSPCGHSCDNNFPAVALPSPHAMSDSMPSLPSMPGRGLPMTVHMSLPGFSEGRIHLACVSTKFLTQDVEVDCA